MVKGNMGQHGLIWIDTHWAELYLLYQFNIQNIHPAHSY